MPELIILLGVMGGRGNTGNLVAWSVGDKRAKLNGGGSKKCSNSIAYLLSYATLESGMTKSQPLRLSSLLHYAWLL